MKTIIKNANFTSFLLWQNFNAANKKLVSAYLTRVKWARGVDTGILKIAKKINVEIANVVKCFLLLVAIMHSD